MIGRLKGDKEKLKEAELSSSPAFFVFLEQISAAWLSSGWSQTNRLQRSFL